MGTARSNFSRRRFRWQRILRETPLLLGPRLLDAFPWAVVGLITGILFQT